jgi:LPXTG-motif cell wall-anchored protein
MLLWDAEATGLSATTMLIIFAGVTLGFGVVVGYFLRRRRRAA